MKTELCGLLICSLYCTAPAAGPDPISAADIDPAKELLITDLRVVRQSPQATHGSGVERFTIEHLLAGIDPDGIAQRPLKAWLHAWVAKQTGLEQESEGPTYAVGQWVIDQWKKKDGCCCPDELWEPNFANAPFRLLAIVNRLDLPQPGTTGADALRAPELRFIYGLLDITGKPLDATVIFEYNLPVKTKADVQKWARTWHEIGSSGHFDQPYCEALARFTESITQRPKPTAPSLLAQIRTNERGLSVKQDAASRWNLREFHLEANQLVVAPTKQTPADTLKMSPLLGDYINTYAQQILNGSYKIEKTYQGQPFMGEQSTVNMEGKVNWLPAGVDTANEKTEAARDKLIHNTCNGCHGTEGGDPFQHVSSHPQNGAAVLSRFLQINCGWAKEITDRQDIMANWFNGITTPAPTSAKGSPNSVLSSKGITDAPAVDDRAGRVH